MEFKCTCSPGCKSILSRCTCKEGCMYIWKHTYAHPNGRCFPTCDNCRHMGWDRAGPSVGFPPAAPTTLYQFSDMSRDLPNPSMIKKRSIQDIQMERKQEQRSYSYIKLEPTEFLSHKDVTLEEMKRTRQEQDRNVKHEDFVMRIPTETVNTKGWSFTDAYKKYEAEHAKPLKPERMDMWNIKQ